MIAGDLIDSEVFVEVFEVVLLDPTAEDEQDHFFAGALDVVAQDGDFDGLAFGIGRSNGDAFKPWVFLPEVVLIAEVISE